MKWNKRILETFSHVFRRFQIQRMEAERDHAKRYHPDRKRILATACFSFPIYSQTFVYQELTQLVKSGFDLRFIYSQLDSRKNIAPQFNPVWHARRRMMLHPKVARQDFLYYNASMPDKIEALTHRICSASGVTPEELRNHHHFNEAFSFVRLVDAYRPDYLHSYFFYEGTLFSLFASYLLDIPRGVSCYADHMLQDYEFKMVPLHLEQCDLIVATSAQIKTELQKIAPAANPNKIIVKPNAINASAFPATIHSETSNGTPFRIVSVCRIEPKKGLIYLVEAIRILKDQGINVHLYHMGGVDHEQYFNDLKSRMKELNVSTLIHLEGSKEQSEIIRAFGKAHVFVAPFIETEYGDKDGIPTSLLEGMASGLPVVTTNAGSIPEVVENGRDGVVVPQRDPQALAQAIASLLMDKEKRNWLGTIAAAKIRAKFDVSVCEQDLHARLTALLVSRIQTLNTNSRPLVSAIIIFYNAKKFFVEAIESILAQTYDNWELLLADDGSTDGSTEIAKDYAVRYPDKIRYLEHEGHVNMGMSATRNLGVRNSKGKYVAFLDADDVWLPHKLERQVAIMESQPEAAMVYGATQYWYGWTGKSEDLARDYVPNLGIPPDKLYRPPDLSIQLYPFSTGTAPCPSDLMLRKNKISEVGGFEESYRGILHLYEDQAFLSKVYITLPVYVSSECWDKYRIHPDSCFATVTRDGHYDTVRIHFLKWFESYLLQREVKTGPVWNALQNSMEAYRKKDAEPIAEPPEPTPLATRQFDWGELRRVTPISRNWGFERGKPIDRYYIESFLSRCSKDIQGRVLEIEDDMYTRLFGGDRANIRDVLHVSEGNPRATIVADLTQADHIPSNQFDCIIVTQTLQLIYDLKSVAKTLHRILKPGGVLLATFPGITRISRTEWAESWYWMLTTASARKLFGEIFGAENVEVESHGNVLVAAAFLYGFALEEFTREELDAQDPEFEVLLTLRASKETSDGNYQA